MTHICSTGIGVPEYEIGQGDIKKLVQEIFVSSDKRLSRLLSVFDNAQVEKDNLLFLLLGLRKIIHSRNEMIYIRSWLFNIRLMR